MKNHIAYLKNAYSIMDTRTKRTANNAFGIFLLKSTGIVTSLLLVPVMLSVLDPYRYGIWLTIASIIAWFNFFDLGLGHGLRNNFVETMAKGDPAGTKIIVSNTYFLSGLVSLAFFVLALIAIPRIDWHTFLNSSAVPQEEIRAALLVVAACFSFNLVLRLISSVLLADQKAALSDLIAQGSLLVTLGAVFFLSGIIRGSLVLVALLIGGIPVLINLVSTGVLYSNRYRRLRPSLTLIDRRLWKTLFSLSSKFFVSQFAAVVLFASANVIISHVAGPEDVTRYNIVLKYLSVPLFLFGVVLTPYWSAITDAQANRDFDWLRRSRRKLVIASAILAGMTLVMLLFSRIVFKLWIGERVDISFWLSLIVAINILIRIFLAPYSTFINGFGKLSLSVIIVIAEVLLYLPLAILCGQRFGVAGVVLALIVAQAISLYFAPAQVGRIIDRTAHGIWDK